jgi:hypothetical protein
MKFPGAMIVLLLPKFSVNWHAIDARIERKHATAVRALVIYLVTNSEYSDCPG